jgi:cytochrome P450
LSIAADHTRTSYQHARDPITIPFRRVTHGLRKTGDLYNALTDIVQEHEGAICRVNMLAFRPYLVTRPEHVEHVLHGATAENYPREGMMWKPMQRLVGEQGIGTHGPTHKAARAALQPAFTGRAFRNAFDGLATAIDEAVEDLVRRSADGRSLDCYIEMTGIIHRAVNNVFFGSRISLDDSAVVGEAIRVAVTSFVARLALPWAPNWVPLPGDKRFKRAVATVDELVLPLVRMAREEGADAPGIAGLLARAGRTDQQIRDDLVATFVAGSESTAVALTWLWPVLEQHPDVAERMYAEVDEVIASGSPSWDQVQRQMPYTRQVLKELLRIYSVGWIIPRKSRDDDVIDGVRIKGGSYIIISPYLTHRVPDVWPDPARFDPDRHDPAPSADRHRLAYLAFGHGEHSCVGQPFFFLEALLILTALLRRCRPVVQHGTTDLKPRVSLALIPNQPVKIALRPRARAERY